MITTLPSAWQEPKMQALRFLGFPPPQGGQILLHDHSVAQTCLGVTKKKKKEKRKKRKKKKKKEKKRKKKKENHSTQDSRVVPHRGTN